MSLAECVLVVLCASALVNGQASIWQNWGVGNFNTNNLRTSWGNQQNNGWWNGPWGNRNRNRDFRTCVGYNNMRDEIRVTVERQEPDVMNRIWNWNQRDTLRFKAVVIARSRLQGHFTFVVTQYSRVEDGCSSQALGDILPSNDFWNQNRPKGIIGSVTIYPGQTTSYSNSINTFTMDEFNGRGVALCQDTRLSGNTCSDLIYLCCKMGRDTRDVTLGYSQGFMQNGVMGTGNIGGGFMGAGTGIGAVGAVGAVGAGGTFGTGGGFTQSGGGLPGGGTFTQTGGVLPTGQDTKTETTVDAGINGLGALTFS